MKLRNNPVLYLLAKVWKYSKGNRHMVVLYMVLFFLANSLYILEPLVLAKVLNTIQTEGLNEGNLFKILGILSLFFILAFVHYLFHGPGRIIELRNSFLAHVNYKQYLLDGVMNLPSAWHTDHHSGDTIDKIEKGTEALSDFSSHNFELLEIIFGFTGSYIALVYFNFQASYIVAIIVISLMTIVWLFDRVLIKQYIRLNRSYNGISAKVYDTISNITTVIILRVEKMLSRALNKKMLQPYDLFKKNILLNEIKWWLVSMGGAIMMVLVLASYIYTNVKSGQVVLIGTLFALYGYLINIHNIFFRTTWFYSELVRTKARILNSEELAEQFTKNKTVPQVSLNKRWQKIEVKNLSFSYPSENQLPEQHLDNISFTLHRGEKIAFVGESGSGKTTALKIIRGLYNPQQVAVYLDGKKLKHHFNSIRDSIALIPQDPEIFNSTIRENITMGVAHTMPKIIRFSLLARFHHTALRLPKKYESSIVERGVNLSGGEKQRLALTRGLLASTDKSIILLDEPTSSVDSKNELEIYQNIFTKFSAKTIISSIHRLHLLGLFDLIYFFDNGKIIAAGNRDKLLQISPKFKKLWEKYQVSNNKIKT